MKLGRFSNIIFFFTFIFTSPVWSIDKIESVPLINLEDLSPTFEEDKDELEKIEKSNDSINNTTKGSFELYLKRFKG